MTSNRPSWFPVNPKAVRGEQLFGMSATLAGAYWLLVCAAWLETPPASIPSDDTWLARNAGFSDVSAWIGCKSAVLSGWTERDDGRLVLPWLREAYDRAATKSRKARKAAAQSVAERSLSERSANAANTPLSSCSGSEGKPKETGFSGFWALWPSHARKVNRKGCQGIWSRDALESLTDTILASLQKWRTSRDWCKNGGEFIPQPATWLNQRRWETEPEPASEGEQPALVSRRLSVAEAAALLGEGES